MQRRGYCATNAAHQLQYNKRGGSMRSAAGIAQRANRVTSENFDLPTTRRASSAIHEQRNSGNVETHKQRNVRLTPRAISAARLWREVRTVAGLCSLPYLLVVLQEGCNSHIGNLVKSPQF